MCRHHTCICSKTLSLHPCVPAGSVIAWAVACDFDLSSSRPTVGVINLCPGLFGGALEVSKWQTANVNSSPPSNSSTTYQVSVLSQLSILIQ